MKPDSEREGLRQLWIDIAGDLADEFYPKGKSKGRGEFLAASGLLAAKLLPAIQAETRRARIAELDNLIGIYNRQNEPNGEFKPFGQMTKSDVADLYLAIGERIRELEQGGGES